jgi:hypothetical protein
MIQSGKTRQTSTTEPRSRGFPEGLLAQRFSAGSSGTGFSKPALARLYIEASAAALDSKRAQARYDEKLGLPQP